MVLTIDEREYPEVIHAAVRVLNHAFVVDGIFKSHLQKKSHNYMATNTEETPSLQVLFSDVKVLDTWYCSYVSNLSDELLQESLQFKFTDGESGSMNREEILLHVITHGGYHRGQVGQIIRAASVNPPRDIFTRYLHVSQPFRRGKNA